MLWYNKQYIMFMCELRIVETDEIYRKTHLINGIDYVKIKCLQRNDEIYSLNHAHDTKSSGS